MSAPPITLSIVFFMAISARAAAGPVTDGSWMPTSPGASVELEGEGSSAVVAGNVVSARSRALERARAAILLQALESSSDGHERAQAATPPAGASLALKSYRVVEEESSEGHYRIRIRASVDLARLRNLVGGTGRRSSSSRQVNAPERRRAALWAAEGSDTPPLLRRRASGQVRRSVESGGFEPLVVTASDVALARAEASRRGAAFLVVLSTLAEPAPGVRGIALSGARAAVTLRLEPLGGEARTQTWTSEEYAAARDQVDAMTRALDAALEGPQRALERAFVPLGPSVAAGARPQTILRLSGLTRLEQVRALCRQMRARSAQVRQCTLRALDRSGALIALITSPTEGITADSALALVSASSAELGLQARSAPPTGDVLTIDVSALPLPSTD